MAAFGEEQREALRLKFKPLDEIDPRRRLAVARDYAALCSASSDSANISAPSASTPPPRRTGTT